MIFMTIITEWRFYLVLHSVLTVFLFVFISFLDTYVKHRVEKNPGFMSIARPRGKTQVFPGFTGQYWVILDLMGLLHKKTDFNYFIKSTSVI